MNKLFVVFASFSGALAVILGALGAHALKDKLDPARLASFETGVKYQIYHALALLLVAILMEKNPAPALKTTGYLFIVGTVIFSGSIYLLSTQELSGISFRFLGPVTPLGGLALIAGWIMMGYAYLKK